MNDRAALEVALAANPDDFATHAAYADLLTEQGDPRGDYIRLQLALEDRHQPVERLRAMEQEAFELRQRHEAEWLGPLAEHVNPSAGGLRSDVNIDVLEANVQVTYRRGWLDTVRVRGLSQAVADALTACPIVQLSSELQVLSGQIPARVLEALPNLTRLHYEENEQSGSDTAPWFHPLVEPGRDVYRYLAPELVPHLRYLALRSPFLGDDVVIRLMFNGVLDRLAGLDLSSCGITDDGAQALATHPAVPKLEYLHLDDNHISPIGIDALAAVGVVISQRQHLGPTPGDDEPADGEIAF